MSVLQIGDRIDRFVVEDFLGEGGISRVYKVRHHQLGTVHALKMMVLKSESLTQRLVREGRIQANLSHPGVVAVTDILEHGGFTGLLMEYVEGRSLDLVLARTGAPPLPEALALFRQMLAGVAAAHEAGVLHRDIKPGNVLLAPEGDGVVAKVTDFGIAKLTVALDGAQTQQSDLMGTPGYMAPEQADDPTAVDVRADIYSLGAVLYCLVTGRPPFAPASLPSLLEAARAGRYPPVGEVAPHVPEAIARVVERCLLPDPNDRFADCRALAEALYGDGGPTFDDEVAGARPAVLHVPGAVTPQADTAQKGGAETRVPSPPTVAPAVAPDGPAPLEDPGPAGKYIFFATAAFVVAALGWLLFQTWARTGAVLPDPERARAAVEAQRPPEATTPAPGPGARVPVAPVVSEEGSVDPGLDGTSAAVAPLGALDGGADPVAEAPEGTPGPAALPSAADPAAPEAAAGAADTGGAAGEAAGGAAAEGAAAADPAGEGADALDAAAGDGALDGDGDPEGEADATAAAEETGPSEAPVLAAEASATPDETDGDAVADASVGSEAPEAAPAPVDLRGTWTGKLGGRPLTLRIMDAAGSTVSAEIDVLVGTTYRTFQVKGPATDGGARLSLAEASGDGWRLDGRFSAGAIEGTILPPGRKRGQAFSVRRQ